MTSEKAPQKALTPLRHVTLLFPSPSLLWLRTQVWWLEFQKLHRAIEQPWIWKPSTKHEENETQKQGMSLTTLPGHHACHGLPASKVLLPERRSPFVFSTVVRILYWHLWIPHLYAFCLSNSAWPWAVTQIYSQKLLFQLCVHLSGKWQKKYVNPHSRSFEYLLRECNLGV